MEKKKLGLGINSCSGPIFVDENRTWRNIPSHQTVPQYAHGNRQLGSAATDLARCAQSMPAHGEMLALIKANWN